MVCGDFDGDGDDECLVAMMGPSPWKVTDTNSPKWLTLVPNAQRDSPIGDILLQMH